MNFVLSHTDKSIIRDIISAYPMATVPELIRHLYTIYGQDMSIVHVMNMGYLIGEMAARKQVKPLNNYQTWQKPN